MIGASEFISALTGALIGGCFAILAAFLTVRWQFPKTVEASLTASRQERRREAAGTLAADVVSLISQVAQFPVDPWKIDERDPTAEWWATLSSGLAGLQVRWRGSYSLHLLDPPLAEAMKVVESDSEFMRGFPPNHETRDLLSAPVRNLGGALEDVERIARDIAASA